MPDASPAKWHLAHTTWFFERFVLRPLLSGYLAFHPRYDFLFNSYYEAIGDRQPRAERGLLTRPLLAEVGAYRQYVDEHLLAALASEVLGENAAALVTLGLNHEQQHQELLLMDLKHAFGAQPLRPVYREPEPPTVESTELAPMKWRTFDAGVHRVGHEGGGFAFDNECPSHRVFLEAFALADRLVTCGEWLKFTDDGGYRRPELWLSDGWDAVRRNGWSAPLYWSNREGEWSVFTLRGTRGLRLDEPVCHVSHYEADAYARWAGARLPTEHEWEIASRHAIGTPHFLERGALHPLPAEHRDGLKQMFGDVWEWTGSAYLPYPGFRPNMGAIGEYSGKFMSGQMVMRGGSCVTPTDHVGPAYRNFFAPGTRWHFSGIRLARSLE